ncbi:MAG: hypothetical protein AAFY20_21740 [Cyanobacteria bacterium J06639_14]
MNLQSFGKPFATVTLSLIATTFFPAATIAGRPAHALEYNDIPPSVINGLLRLEPDFFDRGREQFEGEIDRLTQMDADSITLTIDESIQFDPEVLEKLRGQTGFTDVPPSPASP